MNPVLIVYATREGHTQRVAAQLAEDLRARGVQTVVRPVEGMTAQDSLASYAAVLLAASVHAGRHEPEMIRFVRERLSELERVNSSFLSVTLSEAGVERSDATPVQHATFVADVDAMIQRFIDDTGWHPRRIKNVAGALLYTRYNFLVRLVMKRIARTSGGSTDTSADHDYTDWADLDRFAETIAADVKSAG